jgi:hypothetical protein
MSPAQASLYAELAPYLVSAAQASALGAGEWAAVGDGVFDEQAQVCRAFENRTNADVRWVGVVNCVYRAAAVDFDSVQDFYSSDAVQLESAHEYENEFLLFGYADGHTFFWAWLQAGEHVFWVSLESRTLIGETPADLFSEQVDDFIHQLLMINMGM